MAPTTQLPRIVGAGLPRTGTTSLQRALEILGYGSVLHSHTIEDTPHYKHLLGARIRYPNADLSDLEEVTGQSLAKLTSPYDATMDSPTGEFYLELSQLYPESLVVLTVRDSDQQWWNSWYNTLGRFFTSDLTGRLWRVLLLAAWENHDRHAMMFNYTLLWRQRYGNYGPQIHDQHKSEVMRQIHPDRLLVFNVKEGWAPLCKFLGAEVPTQPFPRVNDLVSFKSRIDVGIRKCYLRWTCMLSLPPCIAYGIYLALSR